MADVSASLVSALFELGADVHVALPHYRRMFHIEVGNLISEELRVYKGKLPDSRIHLAEDRVFYYRDAVYSDYQGDTKLALAFQREVINNIIPLVKPDLVHCNDWMTGLIPPCARRLNIPCLFTVHNIHTHQISLAAIEDNGIDAAEFWRYLYYLRPPANYEESRSANTVDLMTSGIFSAHFINTVSPTFLKEICEGRHSIIPPQIRNEICNKKKAECAAGILNAPDPQFNPATDERIPVRFTAETHPEAKKANKRILQRRLGLEEDETAPLFFWPSRLDPVQKGCQLLASILYDVVSSYWEKDLQIAIVANGTFQKAFHEIADFHQFRHRVAVCDFQEELSHLAYAASDFILIPSLFEPCGLPQMIGTLYGSLPVAHDTGGLHDTVQHLDVDRHTGNGFRFEVYDSNGLRWAIDQAMDFYGLPSDLKAGEIARVMQESQRTFNHAVTAKSYIDIYESMLRRPLVNPF
jgi:ADP-glucose type glycogen/starch synthase